MKTDLLQSCGHCGVFQFSGILSAALSQHHLLGFEIAQNQGPGTFQRFLTLITDKYSGNYEDSLLTHYVTESLRTLEFLLSETSISELVWNGRIKFNMVRLS